MGTEADYFVKQRPLPCLAHYLLDLPPPPPDENGSSEPRLHGRSSSSRSTARRHAKPWLCAKRTSFLYPATCLSELRRWMEMWRFGSVGLLVTVRVVRSWSASLWLLIAGTR